MRRVALAFVLAACGGHPAGPATPVDADAVAARYYDAFTNSFPLLTNDGHVVFVSNRDGLPQLYLGEVAHPDAAPRRLPTPKERVATPVLAPDGKSVLFLSDVGTDQKFHVWRVNLDGSGLADLTPGDDTRRESLHVPRGADLAVYTGHVLADETTHVYVQPFTGVPREVYHDSGVGFVVDVDATAAHVLYLHAESDSSSILYLVDTASGAATRMYPPEGSVQALSDASFLPDGQSFVVSTDEPGRPTRVVRVDTAGTEVARWDEQTSKTAANAGILVSPKGDRAVVVLDAGDHSELRVLDPTTLKALPTPQVPLGVVSMSSFSADGTRLGLSLLGTSGPQDIAALDGSAITPLRHEPRAGIGDPPAASIVKLTAFDGRTLPTNLYLPAHATGKLPTLVLVHGGPSGSSFIGWSATVGFWTAMGFAVVAPNIRGSTGFGLDYTDADNLGKRADALKDMETINRWARAQPWCDGERLVIGGISYGGYMTLLALGRQPTLWRAGIDGSGMSNLVTMEQLEDQQIRAFDDSEFGVLGKDDAILKEWSPLTTVDKIVSPVFVYQGVRDPVTPQKEADQIVDALKARKIPVEYMLLPDEGHGVTRRANVITYLARSYRFVVAHMK